MSLDRVVIASQNPDKIGEIKQVLADLPHPVTIVRGLTWPEPDEPEATLEGNAVRKAREVAAATGHAALADDTGLEVAALGGEPGVRTARFAGPDATYAQNRARLLSALEGEADRRARFRTVVALVAPGGEVTTAEGWIDGEITTEERGERGFGYDPVFAVDGRTFAEMTEADKNAISHRARALRALAAKLG
jgi:XTP/dITP diphosphohydrolase